MLFRLIVYLTCLRLTDGVSFIVVVCFGLGFSCGDFVRLLLVYCVLFGDYVCVLFAVLFMGLLLGLFCLFW